MGVSLLCLLAMFVVQCNMRSLGHGPVRPNFGSQVTVQSGDEKALVEQQQIREEEEEKVLNKQQQIRKEDRLLTKSGVEALFKESESQEVREHMVVEQFPYKLTSGFITSTKRSPLHEQYMTEHKMDNDDITEGGLSTNPLVLILSLGGLIIAVLIYILVCHKVENRDHKMLSSSILGLTALYALAEAVKGSLTLAGIPVPALFDGLVTMLSAFLGLAGAYYTFRSLRPFIPERPRVALQDASRRILGLSPINSQQTRSPDVSDV